MGYASYLEKYEIIRVTPTLSTDAYGVYILTDVS